MPGSEKEIIQQAEEWLTSGTPVYLVTVAKTWGSSPRPPGALMAVTHDGRVAGSVSGGCIEEDLLHRLARESPRRPPFRLCYGTSREEAMFFGLPCGGRLELIVEPLSASGALSELNSALQTGRIVQRTVALDTGSTQIAETRDVAAQFSYDGETLTKIFGPTWKLLIVGAGHISQHLTQFIEPLDFRVLICDPRDSAANNWLTTGALALTSMPDDAVVKYSDSRTAVVTLSHDPKLDDMALFEALVSDAFYVGALGSRKSSAARRKRLLELGLSRQAIERLHAPVGLPLGTRTPAEIALAIAAEIMGCRNGHASIRNRLQRLHSAETAATA